MKLTEPLKGPIIVLPREERTAAGSLPPPDLHPSGTNNVGFSSRPIFRPASESLDSTNSTSQMRPVQNICLVWNATDRH